jgi:hypothetical protein
LPSVRRRAPLTWQRVLYLLSPGLAYLGVRETGLLFLDWMAARNHLSVTNALTSWDGQWYLAIAGGGYSGVPGGLADAYGHRTATTPLAFFPGYPALVRWLTYLPGLGLITAALVITVACGVACAYALMRIARAVHTGQGAHKLGLILVVLFAASPMAIVLSMAYSEAMFCALAAWSLVGLLERKWLLAGVMAAAAGLVRPTGAAVVATVVLVAIVVIVQRRATWRTWVGGLIAPAGLVGYLLFVASRTGSLTGWFELQQEGWDSKFDGGAATVQFGADVLSSGRSVLEVATVAFLILAILLVVIAFRKRVPWPLIVYAIGVLAMDIGSNGLMNSKARMLLPAFTLLVPVAMALAKRQRSTMIMVMIGVVVASSWFGAYSITGWQWAI